MSGKAHSREKLATLLWGDRFEDQARRSLRQCVFALRKELGADVIIGEADLRVPRDIFAVDALTLTPDRDYPGDLLADFRTGEAEFDDWLTAERSRIRSEAALMYRDHADRLDKTGKPEQVLVAAEQALAL